MPTKDLDAAITAAKAAAAVQREGMAVLDPRAATVIGFASPVALAQAQAGGSNASGPARTLLGVSGADVDSLRARGERMAGNATLVAGTPAQIGRQLAAQLGEAALVADGGEGPARTLLGVARPGIAPLEPGIARDTFDDLPVASELGATIAPIPRPARAAARDPRGRAMGDIRPWPPAASDRPAKPESQRALVLAITAGVLALAAVLVGVFWPSAPPLTVRPKADPQGHEALEIHCVSCPDGTQVSIDGATATVTDHEAIVPLASALSVGENHLKVAIDRPGNGRDETVGVKVMVAYRVRPDLGTLQGDRPAISIVAEAARGTTVALDGKPMSLVDGRGLEKFDVVDALSGISDDVKTLSRQIPYAVTPTDGTPESGVVSVSVGIVPLHIDSPGPRVTTDQPSFVLAGHTLKGAEVLAAGRPISVKPDGTFAQVMNVSAVGATQIEVRAKMPGMAPRLLPIQVRRVENLDAAAKEFVTEHPLDFSGASDGGALGKPVVLGGEVLDTRRQGYQTVLLLDVAKQFGCSASDKGGCTVRLVQGGENAAKKGDKIRAFGHVGAPFTAAGKAVPEVLVEFTMKGLS